MKRAALIILATVATAYVAAIFVPIEPEERRPGTRLAGTPTTDRDVDWSFIQGRQRIFLQTNTWYGIPHSVTTTSWVVDGEYYVPCGNCATKRWPRNVEADPDVVLLVDGRLYERKAVLITDPAEKHKVLSTPNGHDLPEGVEVYRMAPRSESAPSS